MRTFAWRHLDEFFVFVHSSAAPSASEWDEVLTAFCKYGDLRRARVLVYTEGGAPNPRQRALLNQVLEAAKPPIAILTASSLARAAGTAISWFNPTIRVFAPDDIEGALDHVDASALDRVRLRRALAELKSELGCR